MTLSFGSRQSPAVDRYISKLKPQIHEIAVALRMLVLEAAPQAEERLSWRVPWYYQNGPLCYINPAAKHVAFGFRWGAKLTDPKGILEGTGKGMRHVKIRSLKEIRKSQFTSWVRESVQLNRAIATWR